MLASLISAFQTEPDEALEPAVFSTLHETLVAANHLNEIVQRHKCPSKPLNLSIAALNSLKSFKPSQEPSRQRVEAADNELLTARNLLQRLLTAARGYQRQRLQKFLRTEQSTLWKARKCCVNALKALDCSVPFDGDENKISDIDGIGARAGKGVAGDNRDGLHEAHDEDSFDDDMSALIDDPDLVPPRSALAPLTETSMRVTRGTELATVKGYGLGSDEPNTIEWEVPNVRVPCSAKVTSLIVSTKHLFAGLEDGDVCIIDLKERKIIQTISCFEASVSALAFTKDEEHFVAGCASGEGGVWRVDDGTREGTLLGLTAAVRCIVLFKDQAGCCMEAVDDSVNAWNFGDEGPKYDTQYRKGARCEVIVGPDAELQPGFLAKFDSFLKNWDESKGLKVVLGGYHETHAEFMRRYGNYVACMAWTGGSRRRTVVGGTDGTVCVLDDNMGIFKLQREHDVPVSCVAVLENVREDARFVTGDDDGVAVVWFVHPVGYFSAKLDSHAGAISCAALSADGEIVVTGSDDRSLRIWECRIDVEVDEAFHGTIP